MWTVYVIYNCDKDKIYIGRTTNLENRLRRHNRLLPTKKTAYTYKNSGDWIVIYAEILETQSSAILREKWFKSGIGREFIKQNKVNWIKMLKR